MSHGILNSFCNEYKKENYFGYYKKYIGLCLSVTIESPYRLSSFIYIHI